MFRLIDCLRFGRRTLTVRVVERVSQSASIAGAKTQEKKAQGLATQFSGYADGSTCPNVQTVGWKPSCDCDAGTEPQVVLDPFSGLATTGVVALGLGRHYIGVELNPEYAALSEKRLRDVHLPLFETLEECFS